MIFVFVTFFLFIISNCYIKKSSDISNDNEYTSIKVGLEQEKNNFEKIYQSSQEYLTKLENHKSYLKFIQNINDEFYHSLNKNYNSLQLRLIPSLNILQNSKNCISYHLIIGIKCEYLLCINNKYNMLSLYNITSEKNNSTLIKNISINITLNYSYPIQVSFSAFDEEQTKIYIFNNNHIFSLLLKFNYRLDDIMLFSIKNFTINNIITTIENDLIYLSTTLYHGNRYIIYGYSNGKIFVYLIRDKTNISENNYVSIRTVFNLHKKIDKIYQTQGYLFVVTDDRKKINVLSLLGSNSILVNCYNYNSIVDLVFEYKKYLLYVLDNKGNVFIKELVLSVSKAYTNTCKNIYYIQLPDYVVKKHNNNFLSNQINLIMTRNLNTVYILGNNYLGYINNKFVLENYLIYNQKNNNKNNNLEENSNIFVKNGLIFLLSNYKDELVIYEIKTISNKNNKNINKDQSTKNENQKNIYSQIDDNSGIVECNGNHICKLLFNTLTNNRYTINTLYIVFILIIITTIYHFKKNKNNSNKNRKQFKEDLDNISNDKLTEMLKQIKNMGHFENFSDYKKRQKENSENFAMSKNFREGDAFDEEGNKDYYGDDDDDNEESKESNKEENEEFLEKAYRNYVNQMMKNEKKKKGMMDNNNAIAECDEDCEYEEDTNNNNSNNNTNENNNNINRNNNIVNNNNNVNRNVNNINNNSGDYVNRNLSNRIEERKDQTSDEESEREMNNDG